MTKKGKRRKLKGSTGGSREAFVPSLSAASQESTPGSPRSILGGAFTSPSKRSRSIRGSALTSPASIANVVPESSCGELCSTSSKPSLEFISEQPIWKPGPGDAWWLTNGPETMQITVSPTKSGLVAEIMEHAGQFDSGINDFRCVRRKEVKSVEEGKRWVVWALLYLPKAEPSFG